MYIVLCPKHLYCIWFMTRKEYTGNYIGVFNLLGFKIREESLFLNDIWYFSLVFKFSFIFINIIP